MRRLFLILLVALPALFLSVGNGDIHVTLFGKTIRHWSVVPMATTACAFPGSSGGYNVGGCAGQAGGGGGGVPSFVQSKSCDFVVASGSLACVFGAGTLAGSIIATCGSYDAGAGAVTITDNNGDAIQTSIATYVPASLTTLKVNCSVFTSTTAGTTTVTWTYGGANPGFGDFYMWEFKGVNTKSTDQTSTGTGRGAGGGAQTTFDSGTTANGATPTDAAVCYSATSNTSISINSPWASDGITTHTASIGGHQITANNGGVDCNGTTTDGWAADAVTYK